MAKQILAGDVQHAIKGVNGRITHRTTKPDQSPELWFKQRWISESRKVDGYGVPASMTVSIRFDDECGNKHNTFAITADVRTSDKRYSRDKGFIAGGCMHDEICTVFPELAPLIQWHLVSTNGPMHYIANVCYLAGNLDCNGKAKGEPISFEYGLRFGNSPILFKLSDRFRNWLYAALDFNSSVPSSNPNYVRFDIVEIEHEKEANSSFAYSPKYTFAGFDCKWYQCPFDTLAEIEDFKKALSLPMERVRIPTRFSEGKLRELDSARRVACWPDATDEELCLPRAELAAILEKRLPALMADFKQTIVDAGFFWSADDYRASHMGE